MSSALPFNPVGTRPVGGLAVLAQKEFGVEHVLLSSALYVRFGNGCWAFEIIPTPASIATKRSFFTAPPPQMISVPSTRHHQRPHSRPTQFYVHLPAGEPFGRNSRGTARRLSPFPWHHNLQSPQKRPIRVVIG